MALAIPSALKQLLGLSVAPPSPTAGMSSSPDTPAAVAKVFGPAVNPTDQATAEAKDPTGASLAVRPDTTAGVSVPPSLKKAAAAAPSDTSAPTIVPSSKTDPADVAAATPTSEAPPSLAPQGSSHAIPAALLRLTGITAAQPKPGELYNGPTTPDAKMKAGVGFVGRLGNALAAAAGTPEQKELAEKRSEFGPELKAKEDIAQAQIKSLGDYRRGELQNVAARNDIQQQKADQQNEQAVAKMRARGYVPDETNPGTFRSMTADEILADPVLSKKQDLAQAAAIQKSAESSLAAARQDALMNPNNPTLALKARQIEATLKMAQANLALRAHALSNQDASLAMRGKEALWNFGENPLTGERQTTENMAPAAMVDGEPTPMKSSYFPTAQMRNVGAQAHLAAQGIPGTINEVKTLSDRLGPVAGRWNDFMQGKVGMDDPDFAGLRADLLMVSSAVALAHARGRLPENLREEFDNMMNAPQQTPENIVSILSHIQPWMEKASHMQVPRSAASPAAGAAGGVSPAGPKVGDVVKGYRFKGGDPSNKASWEKQ